jgi:hypothetical protein
MFLILKIQKTMSAQPSIIETVTEETSILTENFNYIITAAKELQSSSEETHEILRQFIEHLKETTELYGLNKDTSKSPLISLGITMLVMPDPITTPIGAGMIIFGIAQNKLVGQPLYIKDLYEEIDKNMQELITDSDLFAHVIRVDQVDALEQ